MLKLSFKIFVLTLAFSSCNLLGDDSNTLVKESANVGHDKKVFLFLREAGATVSDSYQVTIADFENKFDKSEIGNTFTVDTDHGKTWFNSSSINFTWLANDTLQIDYDKKLRTFIQEKKVRGVTIFYKAR